MSQSETLKIVIVGHVDHGKSTLIGRLFYDTGSIPESRRQEIAATCKAQGRPFEFAYLMDALEEERVQNITIDTASSFFSTARRRYVIIDAPGHKQFLKNMITGAASADAAILLVDGTEGVREQTKRHAHVLSLLGIRQVVVAVNKLDMIDYDRQRFQEVENDIRAFLHSLHIVPAHVIPISAREGENMAGRQGHTPWYAGPTILEALDAFGDVRGDATLPLRMPVQDVYTWDGRRIYAGRVETGEIRQGDEVIFQPSGKVTRVKSVEKWREPGLERAGAGECVGITTEDELFVERGEIIARLQQAPIRTREFRASIFWLADTPFRAGATYTIKLATAEVQAVAVDIEERLDSSTLEVIGRHESELQPTEVGTVLFSLKTPLAVDRYGENVRTGRFVIQDSLQIGGGGTIQIVEGDADSAVPRFSLDDFLVGADGARVVDLSLERNGVELDVTPGFLDHLSAGNRLIVRLRDPGQIEPVALLAYEHNLGFVFSRDRDRVNVVLYRERDRGAESRAAA
ncbi:MULTISPECIES: sulfate adenylyltransferase subunit 1 [Geobacter]|uniref:sulfate adenylyltransferase subunit 1 n=1 Tax=Geobacter TaxID=28231 RepID=UPI002572EDC6|nr:GTP-binding protein [Geobacter sulfurreducens]BEH10296.1 GTP-binding protein [Geobacter sulfurreducens subsp. ethanolicus]BET58119.1 GTP-binding protein [Geobacter sp. 60473]